MQVANIVPILIPVIVPSAIIILVISALFFFIGRTVKKLIKDAVLLERQKSQNEITLLNIKLSQLRTKLEQFAYFDSVTGLMNRHALEENAARILSHAKRHKNYIALLYIDIDNFKKVNDSFGHSIGDSILQMFGERLTSVLRKEDIVSRYGGDEFVVVLVGIKDLHESIVVVQRIISKVRQPYNIDSIVDTHNGDVPNIVTITDIGTSIGVAYLQHLEQDLTELLKNADIALYKAKKTGKGAYFVYHSEIALS